MVRLTAELIRSTRVRFNPVGDRVLDLRGNRITAIENFGPATTGYDNIDFTDNAIDHLGGFPHSDRIHTLVLTRNRVRTIDQSIGEKLPKLRVLIMFDCQIAELADLNPLQGCTELETLILIRNPVTTKPNYRAYVSWLCPQVRMLDHVFVKQKTRKEAAELFGTPEEPTELAKQVGSVRTRVMQPTAGFSGRPSDTGVVPPLSDEDKKRYRELLENATLPQQIEQLEQMMMEGKKPPKA